MNSVYIIHTYGYHVYSNLSCNDQVLMKATAIAETYKVSIHFQDQSYTFYANMSLSFKWNILKLWGQYNYNTSPRKSFISIIIKVTVIILYTFTMIKTLSITTGCPKKQVWGSTKEDFVVCTTMHCVGYKWFLAPVSTGSHRDFSAL